MAARDGHIAPPRGIRRVSVQSKNFTIDTADIRVVCFTQTCGALGNSLHYRLQIRRRPGDDAEDFTGRSLLLQRFFEFLEQPHILNRDDGLVGEGFEKRDLLLGEGSNFCTANRNHSNRCSLPQQRRAKDSPSSSALLEESRFWKLRVKFSGDVMDMDCRPVDHSPSSRIGTTEERLGRARHGSIFCHSLERLSPDKATYSCVICLT